MLIGLIGENCSGKSTLANNSSMMGSMILYMMEHWTILTCCAKRLERI